MLHAVPDCALEALCLWLHLDKIACRQCTLSGIHVSLASSPQQDLTAAMCCGLLSAHILSLSLSLSLSPLRPDLAGASCR